MLGGPKNVIPLLAGAIILPILIFLSLQVAFDYRHQSSVAENATLERARRIVEHVDARLDRTRVALSILGTIRSIDEKNWNEAYRRVQEIMKLNPGWRAVRFIDLDNKTEIFDTRASLGEAKPAEDRAPDKDVMTVGGVETDALGCACVSVESAVRRDGAPKYLFVLIFDTQEFQNVVLADAPSAGVTAVVDRQGRFIARTLNYAERVGKPATQFVRDAIKGGMSGIYRGMTYEGLQNYTAFYTSPMTGWSAHVAVSSAVIDAPFRRAWLATILAALVSAALAVLLTLFSLRILASQRRSAERMQHAQRAEAIGQLAGGIAHDFNNMLAIVIGSLDLARRRLATGNTDVSRHIAGAMEGATRAAALTKKMLAFSRRQQLSPSRIDVNGLVLGMRDLMERTLEATIRIETRLGNDVWPVHADSGELENAIVNLAVNARDAMPEGGRLTIATENVPAPKTKRGDSADQVKIVVSDTGAGMTKEVATRAFEPFFSTKTVGKGTGLGLSQVLGFVQQSGGSVEIDSEPGSGTRVTILLPRDVSDVERPREEPAAAAGSPLGSASEVVLVVEDEKQVRLTAVEALRELGYSVLHAPNGEAALELLKSQPGVMLLFTDIVMPGLSGRELAVQAARIAPEVKILFTTGYEGAPLIAPGTALLRKPYSIDDLGRRVRQMFDA